jgi:hypothetical protein
MLLHATVCCHDGVTLTKICDAGRPATFYCDLHSERNNVIDHSCTPTNRRKGAQAFDKLNCSEIPIGFDRNCPSCLQDIDLSGAGFPVTTLNRSIVFVLGGPGSGKGTQVSPLTSTHVHSLPACFTHQPFMANDCFHHHQIPNANNDDLGYMS